MDLPLWATAHLLVIGYWLGTDLAVYYLSGFIVDPSQPRPARLLATRAMLILDMIPRTAMILTALLGLILAARMGLIPGLQAWLPLVWVVALAWLALTWTVFRQQGKPLGLQLGRLDFGFRILLVLLSTLLMLDSFGGGRLIAPAPWLGLKIGLFGLTIAMGLVIRLQLRPFGPLFGKVAAGTASAEDESALQTLMAHVKIPVWVIWIALLIAAVLGRTRGLGLLS